MKKFFFTVVAFLVVSQLFAQDIYYWYKNTKQELAVDFQRRYITVKSLSDASYIQNELTALGIKYDEFEKIFIDSSFNDSLNVYWSCLYMSDSNIEYSPHQISYSSPSYILNDGKHVSVSHLVYVMLKSEADTALLESIANSYGVTILGESKIIPRLYTLSCTNASTYDALGLANALHASNLFEYAEPDIISTELFCVNDTYFSGQWALNNTGQFSGYSGIDINYCSARQITTGNSNVVVAVVDQGVE